MKERLCSRRHMHKRDVFHAAMAQGSTYGFWDMPRLDSVFAVPPQLVSFSAARRAGVRASRPGQCVHFYEDDSEFECFWNDPKRYLPLLKAYGLAIEPDFSTCRDFPAPLRLYNTYRNRQLAAWMQRQGITVVPNVRICLDSSNCPGLERASLEGIPHGSCVAIGARTCVRRREERAYFIKGLKRSVDALVPRQIIWYGSDAYGVAEYPRSLGILVIVYEGASRGDLNPAGMKVRHER